MAAIGASTDRNQDFLGAALSDGGCHGSMLMVTACGTAVTVE